MSISNLRSAAILALAMSACSPQSAKLTEGTVLGFLSAETSFTLIKGSFDPADVTSDVGGDNWNVDCRELDRSERDLRLDEPLRICGNNWPPTEESWLADGAWRGFEMPLDPWRGEGIMTNEGDFQVGFHHRLPVVSADGNYKGKAADFRFSFVIDPDFQPTLCVDNGGTIEAQNYDGDWVGEWSKDLERIANDNRAPEFLKSVAEEFTDGRLYHLNGRSVQLNPEGLDSLTNRTWSLLQEWQAGYAHGTFAEEDLHSRGTQFGTTHAYIQGQAELGEVISADEVWYGECKPEQGQDSFSTCSKYQQKWDQALEAAVQTSRDLDRVVPGDSANYRPIAHKNEWRKIDGEIGGMDAWTENNFSWVVISADSNVEKGGSVKGAFSILLDPNDSSSRFIVQGRFEVPNVKGDLWGPPDLYQDKLDEAGVNLCIK